MTLIQRYELNNPPVIAELVEGEVIAIDLERGSYYSLLGPAAKPLLPVVMSWKSLAGRL